METTKQFRLSFEDAEGWSTDQVCVEVRAYFDGDHIVVQIDNALDRYRIEKIEELNSFVEPVEAEEPRTLKDYDLEELEAEVLRRKNQSEGHESFVQQGWQLFDQEIYFNGESGIEYHVLQHLFAPEIDLALWKSVVFLRGGRELEQFNEWVQSLPQSRVCLSEFPGYPF